MVSVASWAPSKRVNPSTTISSRRCVCWIPSLDVKVSHHDVCRNALLPVPMRNPWLLELPRTLLDGGHGSRGDGHISKCGRKAMGGGGDDTTEPRTVVDRSALNKTSGKP